FRRSRARGRLHSGGTDAVHQPVCSEQTGSSTGGKPGRDAAGSARLTGHPHGGRQGRAPPGRGDAHAFAEYRRLYPNVTIHLLEGGSRAIEQAVMTGELELGASLTPDDPAFAPASKSASPPKKAGAVVRPTFLPHWWRQVKAWCCCLRWLPRRWSG
nr:hypothetical protein [Tanacetum cinerariifolium]